MIEGLTLPLGRLRPVRLREIQESAVCFSYDKRGIHILVQRAGDSATAVFLNGDYAFRSFKIDVTHDWKGLAVTDFDIVVDLASAFDTENQWPTPGTIMISSEGTKLGVTVLNHLNFVDKETIKLDVSIPKVAPGLSVGFRRWAFRFQEGDESRMVWIEADASESGA